jgi:hypothetical protein
MIIAFIAVFLLIYDSLYNSYYKNCDDEFHGDEDDCDDK